MLIITVPHARCPHASPEGHECDTSARASALQLQSIARARGVATKTFIAPVERRVCDLNRDTCANHPWRTQIREAVARAGRGVSLVDVHSFPPNTNSFGSPDPAFVVLYVSSSDYLPLPGARWLQGGNNSIVNEFHEKVDGVCLLVEVNEGLSASERTAFFETLVQYI